MDRLSKQGMQAHRVISIGRFSSLPGFACALLLAILVNFLQAGGHETQRIVEVVFLGFGGLALALLAGRMQVAANVGSGIGLALAVVFAVGLVSSARSYSPVHALYEVGSMSLLLLMALAAANGLAREPSMLPRLLQFFAAIAAVYALKIIAVYVSVWIVQIQPASVHFTPGFSNIRHFNHAETAGLPLLMLAWLLTPRGNRLRWLWFGTAVLWWAVMFMTAGRGSMVGLAAGCIALLMVRGRSALPMVRAMLLSAVAGAIVYFVFFVLIPQAAGMLPFGELSQMVARSVSDPSSGRTFLWKLAASLIASHPWLGVGPLHFAHYGAHLHLGAHPHDWMLQIAVEWGIPALAALCIAILLAARGLLAAAARVDKHDAANLNIVAALILAGAALLVDGMVSGSLVMPQSQLMIAFYVACAAGWSWSRDVRSVPATRTQSATLSLIAAVSVIALVYGVAPQFGDKLADRPQTAIEAKTNGVDAAWPRQWLWGYF